MYVESIHEFIPDNIRQTANFTAGLYITKKVLYEDPKARDPKIVKVDASVEVLFDSDIREVVRIPLPNDLPPEWSPGLKVRFSREALERLNLGRTWLAKMPINRIIKEANAVGTVAVRGLRTKGRYEPVDELIIEVILPIYHCAVSIIGKHELFELIQVRK